MDSTKRIGVLQHRTSSSFGVKKPEPPANMTQVESHLGLDRAKSRDMQLFASSKIKELEIKHKRYRSEVEKRDFEPVLEALEDKYHAIWDDREEYDANTIYISLQKLLQRVLYNKKRQKGVKGQAKPARSRLGEARGTASINKPRLTNLYRQSNEERKTRRKG